jgi:hypothetical protein
MRNVLVISSSERPMAALRDALGDDVGEVRVVVPTVKQSRLQWLTNDEDAARERADKAASAIAEALPAENTEAAAGDSDPCSRPRTRCGTSPPTRWSSSRVPTRRRPGSRRAARRRSLASWEGSRSRASR